MDNKFTWGDPIVVVKEAPACFHPDEFASICDFYKIKSEETAREFQCDVGDWI